jgi:hypothetical protein
LFLPLVSCSADGLAQQVLSSLAKLKAGKDAVLGVAATIALLMLTSEDAHPAYLASVAAAVLIEQLLQVSSLLLSSSYVGSVSCTCMSFVASCSSILAHVLPAADGLHEHCWVAAACVLAAGQRVLLA